MSRAPVGGVEIETGDDVVDDGARDIDFGEQVAEAVEGGVAGRLPRIGPIGQLANPRHRRLGIMARGHRAAMVLPVGQVVGGAAPGVEQPHPLARFAVEQLAREREAFRSPRDAVVREAMEKVGVVKNRDSPYLFTTDAAIR